METRAADDITGMDSRLSFTSSCGSISVGENASSLASAMESMCPPTMIPCFVSICRAMPPAMQSGAVILAEKGPPPAMFSASP